MAGGKIRLERGVLLSVVGMLITLVNFMMCHKWVKENGSKPDFKPLHLPKLLMVLVGIVALIAVSSWLLLTR